LTKEIKVYSKIEYKIDFFGDKFLEPNNSEHILNIIKRRVTNPKVFENSGINNLMQRDSNKIGYLIITTNDYYEAADSLAMWKKQLGYQTEIISTFNWSTNTIKNIIKNRYENQIPKPDYFVIIGDNNSVPAETKTDDDGENYVTDLYYACMYGSNDYTADMAHGRISVQSSLEAMSVVRKIINYERNPLNNSDFYKNGLHCAQFQDYDEDDEGNITDPRDGFAARRFTHTSEDIRNYMQDQQEYTVQRIYYTDPINTPTNYNNGRFSDGQAIPTELLRSNGFEWNGTAVHLI